VRAMRAFVLVAALVLVFGGAPARAADQTVAGKLILVKNNLDPAKRKAKFLAKELGSASTLVGNPLADGATFEVFLKAEIGTDSQQCFVLPPAGWSPISSIGYKYKDASGAHGAVKTAAIKRTPSGTFLLKVVVNGANGPVALQPPTRTEEADVFFRLGDGDRYCAAFGGTYLADNVSAFKAKNAPEPSSCAGAFLVCSPSGAFVDE
jgi:hypothetical protein